MAVAQRPLHRPKSKIRLRLGLTFSPDKTDTSSPTMQEREQQQQHQHHQPQQQHHQHGHQLQSHPIEDTTATTTLSLSLSPPSNNHLNTSVSSRADSRSAFTFDSSPPSRGVPSPIRPTFDTVSYATSSPVSEHMDLDDSYGGTLLSSNYSDNIAVSAAGLAYLAPSPSSSPSAQHRHREQFSSPNLEVYHASSHPHIAQAAAATDDIFSLTDQQLSDRFYFLAEIGFGNWGSVWMCKPKRPRASQIGNDEPSVKLGRVAAIGGGSGAGGRVAVKLVHRAKTPTTAARVRALWGEMKIIRSLRHEPHPSIIQFEAFVITPSMALIIMPYLSHLIPVEIPVERATPYFRQLASAIGYLHERGITHNDIKPSNVLLSYNDVPVLVDFGFANKWDVGDRGSFLSTISWGTPEYLDPQRALGLPHDERASDVWSLGITMFEVLVGRTPFEITEEESLESPDELLVYHERTKKGQWIGEWKMPRDIEHLLRHMICPDPAYRISAMQAYHHPALQPPAPSVIITPHFVRAAASFDFADEPVPSVPYEHAPDANVKAKSKTATANGEKKTRKKKRSKDAVRPSTPALGESIKQHTSIGKLRPTKATSGIAGVQDDGQIDSLGKDKYVIKKTREESAIVPRKLKAKEEDPTPTKVVKPAHSLRIRDPATDDQSATLRVSQSEHSTLSRPQSTVSLVSYRDKDARRSSVTIPSTITTSTNIESCTRDSADGNYRLSAISASSATTTTTLAPKSKDEAMLRAMRSLEGIKKDNNGPRRDFVAHIRRPAPPAPEEAPARPTSLDSAKDRDIRVRGVVRKVDSRRSLGIERVVNLLDGVAEVDEKSSPGRSASGQTVKAVETTVIDTLSSATAQEFCLKESPAQRVITTEQCVPSIVATNAPVINTAIPEAALASEPTLEGLRNKILSDDMDKVTQYRTSVELLPSMLPVQRPEGPPSPVRKAKQSTAPTAFSVTRNSDALALDSRLDRLAEWVKNAELVVEEARKALAEGREPPLPMMRMPMDLDPLSVAFSLPHAPSVLSFNEVASAIETTSADDNVIPSKRFGVTPDKAIPAHLRTGSTQVEPATPPKWFTQGEVEARVRSANTDEATSVSVSATSASVATVVPNIATIHPPVPRMMPIKKERPTVSHVLKLFGGDKSHVDSPLSDTPDQLREPRLKTLRGTPSTPALRAATSRRMPTTRKSESNLRNFNTAPSTSSPLAVGLHDEIDEMDGVVLGGQSSVTYRGIYEQLLDSTPGVVRKGDGWESDLALAPPPPIRPMAKPSSMASLRDRARAFLGDTGGRKIISLADEVETLAVAEAQLNGGGSGGQRNSRAYSALMTPTPAAASRPQTPGATSMLDMGKPHDSKFSGFFKRLGGRGKKPTLVPASTAVSSVAMGIEQLKETPA